MPDSAQSAPAPHARAPRRVPAFALALFLGAALFGGGLFLLSVNAPQPTPVSFERPGVFLETPDQEGMGGLLSEQAALFDTEPLFLPTRRNAGRAGSLADFAQTRGIVPFAAYELPLVLDEKNLLAEIDRSVAPVPSPERLLAQWTQAYAAQFGKTQQAKALSNRSALMRLSRDFEPVREITILDDSFPILSEPLWAPVDFLVMVGPSGELLGEPLPTKSSGYEQVDAALRILVRRYLLGEGLRQGYYRLSIMP